MNARHGAIAVLAAAAPAAGGLCASPSHSAGNPPDCDPFFGCPLSLTGSDPSPSALTINALQYVRFYNEDSVPHAVVFANGLCSLTVPPKESGRWQGLAYANRFMSFVGSYAYTVDGNFPGTVVTKPLRRLVTITARTHTTRGGTGLTLHGRVTRSDRGGSPPAPVVVLARHNGKQPFEPIATVRTRFQGNDHAIYGWKLSVQPEVTTTYVATGRGQRLCYFPASRCAHPQGQVWTNATSRRFTVRIRH